MTQLSETERFWSKVDKSGECWQWTAGRDSDGYGHFKTSLPESKCVQAHRFSYAEFIGTHVTELNSDVVMHSCDNPGCVNPDHLSAGTHAKNVKDRDDKNRGGGHRRRGRGNGRVLLEPSDVLCIRDRMKLGDSQRNIARDYLVSRATISAISTRKNWSHIK